MNVNILILASKDDVSVRFKKEWVKNIKDISGQPLTIVPKFYFIYGNNSSIVRIVDKEFYTNIYCNCQETFENMFEKTIISLNIIPRTTFTIRTNSSTMFDFKTLGIFLSAIKHDKNFFAGPFIGHTLDISGTCLVMTSDIVDYLIQNKNWFHYIYNEDVRINRIIQMKIEFNTVNIKRIDFINNYCLYHKCNINDLDIFCFRFKTDDRKLDAYRMNHLRIALKSNDSYKNFCHLLYNDDIISETQNYTNSTN